MVPHIADRVSIWLHPWQDATDKGYQLVQSIYAISGGGVFGQGLGRGVLLTRGGEHLHPVPRHGLHLLRHRPGAGTRGRGGVILLYLVFAFRGFRNT